MFHRSHHGLGGLLGAVLAIFAVDSTEKRRRLDEQLAEQRAALAAEQRRLRADAVALAAQRRAAKIERRKLLLQRVYGSLVQTLSAVSCAPIGDLRTVVGDAAIAKFAATATSIVARELCAED